MKLQIKLNSEKYRDTVKACWLGKNIGGTFGAPYEGSRKTWDVKGFATAPGEPVPNDDLDLQLIWLHAVESHGPRAVSAAMLGEHWMSLIPPNWNEYGVGKGNMKRGLTPPISGDYENSWKNSNGAWIRTEIWACLSPGCPEFAAKYAMEDAKVDHGAGEGTVAAAFVAAMQSAAFVIKDIRKCIEIAVCAIPKDTRMADSVRFVLECYDKGMTYMDARNAIFERNADIGDSWFEAPSNVSYAIIGLLWGEGDFKNSVIYACNCGDDTDCTCATVGSTMGILYGMKGIPEDWMAYIGDEIITLSVNKGDADAGALVPKTCTELTERVCKQAPHALFANSASTIIGDFDDEFPADTAEFLQEKCVKLCDETVFVPFSAHYEGNCLIADIVLNRAPDIAPGDEIEATVYVRAHTSLGDDIINLTCRWWLPEGFTIENGRKTAVLTHKNSHDSGVATLKYKIKAGEVVGAVNRCVLEIVPESRFSVLYIPVVLLG